MRRWTFKQPKLKAWVESWCMEPVLNLFAGKTLLDIPEFRVDDNPAMPADIHQDSLQFLRDYCGAPFGTAILDPPYTYRKSKEMYGGHRLGQLPQVKDALLRVLSPDARVISLGYDTVGMSKIRGFTKIAICVVCHGGDQRDTLAVVEERDK